MTSLIPTPAPSPEEQNIPEEQIAIIGMAGRLPGAEDLTAFWHSQLARSPGTRRLSREEMARNGRPRHELDRPDLVPLAATLTDIDCFDAPFFRFSGPEAEILDPQIRLLHEVAWHTLENAGCDPARSHDRIGVFASAHMSTYWLYNLDGLYRCSDPNALLQIVAGNGQDYPATTLAYRLGLTGPALNINTACSSSLVSAAVACQHLIDGSCDAALVVSASITLPQGTGYLATADSIYSPDGVCRPFDAAANGTVASDGVVGVLLKRLGDAREAGDRVLAVIRGWATNNDGARKIGFTAPSLDGQIEVLRDAAASAGIVPGDLDYIETHGTGTSVGDPIEFAALKAVHGTPPVPGHRIALGGAKASIGHLGSAAGLAGLIRTTLALRHGIMPGTATFRDLNPRIDAQGCALDVLGPPQAFPPRPRPTRAGVSSFGIGGTNAHLIVEAAPAPDPSATAGSCPEAAADPCPEAFAVSAYDRDSLDRQRHRLADWLDSGQVPATETAFPTLAALSDSSVLDRAALPFRLAVSATSAPALAQALRQATLPETAAARAAPMVCFVFTGSGVPSLSRCRELVRFCPAFAEALADVEHALAAQGLPSARDWLERDGSDKDERDLHRSHLAAFAFGYAMAKMLMAQGSPPSVVLGHSMGEIAAACIAGAVDLPAALAFVAARAAIIMDTGGAGDLLAVSAPAEQVSLFLGADPALTVAGYNGTGQTLVAGPVAPVARLKEALTAQGIPATILPAGKPFHSPLMAATTLPVAQAATGQFRVAQTAIASTVTGRLERDAVADPGHWAAQMEAPVQLTAAIEAAAAAGCTLFLEIGPRGTFAVGGRKTLLTCAPGALWHAVLDPRGVPRDASVLTALAATRTALWVAGIHTRPAHRSRAPRTTLPGYAFSRLRYWRAPPMTDHHTTATPAPLPLRGDLPISVRTGADHSNSDEGDALLRTLLAEIWCEELGVARIEDTDSFMGLGGTSLAALKVAGTTETRLGLRPPLVLLTRAGTFAEYVGALRGLLLDEQTPDSPATLSPATLEPIE